MSRWPCKDYLKGTCTNSFCEKWHPPECLFYNSENGCRLGEKCSYAHRQVDEQPSKRSKKNDDKSAVARCWRRMSCMIERGNPLSAVTQVTRQASNLEECSSFWKMLTVTPDDIKGRSPRMRHVSRTRRVALDWLFDRIYFLTPKSKSSTSTPKTNLLTW